MNETFNKNAQVKQLTEMLLSREEEKCLIVKDPLNNASWKSTYSWDELVCNGDWEKSEKNMEYRFFDILMQVLFAGCTYAFSNLPFSDAQQKWGSLDFCNLSQFTFWPTHTLRASPATCPYPKSWQVTAPSLGQKMPPTYLTSNYYRLTKARSSNLWLYTWVIHAYSFWYGDTLVSICA